VQNVQKKHQKTKSAFAKSCLFKKLIFFLKIMPDRGFRNDMKKLQILCSICPWDGLFKDYEVKQLYFIQINFIWTRAFIRTDRIFLKNVLIKLLPAQKSILDQIYANIMVFSRYVEAAARRLGWKCQLDTMTFSKDIHQTKIEYSSFSSSKFSTALR